MCLYLGGSVTSHLFCALDLLQEGAQLFGFGVKRSTHGLVVTGSIRWGGQVKGAQLDTVNRAIHSARFTL